MWKELGYKVDPDCYNYPENLSWYRCANEMVEWLQQPENADILKVFIAHLKGEYYRPHWALNEQQDKRLNTKFGTYDEGQSGFSSGIVLLLIHDELLRQQLAKV